MKNLTAIIALAAVLLVIPITARSEWDMTSTALWPDRAAAIEKSGITGFGILYRFPGQWSGPVSSDTPAGNFPVWYVDFRPVSPAQISQYSSVDPTMCNYVSIFIVRHEGRLRVAMRTDAAFRGKGCITYEVMQEADEGKGYYKFSDFQSGDRRAYTVFRFHGDDQFEMQVYTNKFNKLKEPSLHSRWNARRALLESAAEAIRHFNYPRPVMVKDFTNAFGNAHESIFFEVGKDPYPCAQDPYVGSATFHITVGGTLKQSSTDELFLMLTTRPIFEGTRYFPERLKYISKFVYLPAVTRNYTLGHLHPGTYYLNSYNDVNRDRKHRRGDYLSSKIDRRITVPGGKRIDVDTLIDFVIP
ncbi:MAG: hypothetical protein JXA20_08660 [Spirochaetes bacterium]|nr:hypothetical protein [Spirochaetota bacterium]